MSNSARLIEFAFGLVLLGADATRFDFCARVVLALDRLARDSSQHRNLADVRQRIRNRALKNSFA